MSRSKSKLRALNKPFYSYWQALYLSFYSEEVYVDVAKRWRGMGALYFLILLAVLSLPFAARIAGDIHYYFRENIQAPLAKLPPIQIKNGRAILAQPMPYMIKNIHGQVITIVDTTGKINQLTDFPYAKILLTQHAMTSRLPSMKISLLNDLSNENNTHIESFNDYSDQIFSGQHILDKAHITRLKYMLEFVIYPLLVLLGFCILFFQYTLLAILGQCIARVIFKLRLKFSTTCRLLLVAATPQLTVMFVALTLHFFVASLALLYIVALLGYFCYALLVVKRASQQLV